MIRFRPLPLMSALTIVALGVLVALGRWQLERFELKRAAGETPVLETTIANYQPIPEGLQFVHAMRLDTREQGWRVFAPVRYGDQIVFVDADFIAEVVGPDWREVHFPAALGFGAPIRGASISPEPPAALTLAPRLARRLWYAVDLEAMGRNSGLGDVADYYLATAYVGADGRAAPNPFAYAQGAGPMPPARHLGYALTWYGLALVLAVIYFAYHVSVGRLTRAPPRRPDG